MILGYCDDNEGDVDGSNDGIRDGCGVGYVVGFRDMYCDGSGEEDGVIDGTRVDSIDRFKVGTMFIEGSIEGSVDVFNELFWSSIRCIEGGALDGFMDGP